MSDTNVHAPSGRRVECRCGLAEGQARPAQYPAGVSPVRLRRHRQDQDDPIVRLSMDIREGRKLEPGQYGETVIVNRATLDPQRVLEADQVLVGRNVTRRAYNQRMRERRGFVGGLPMLGDKLVCL